MLQQKAFAEVDQIVEQSEEDASALDELAVQRSQMEAQADSWKKEITYEADVGVIRTGYHFGFRHAVDAALLLDHADKGVLV